MHDPAGTLLPAHMSARGLLGPRALAVVTAALAALAALIWAWPSVLAPVITGVVAFTHLVSTVDRNYLLFRGLRMSSLVTVSADEARAIPDDGFPVYTVLLPVYDDPTIVTNLINGVGRLDSTRRTNWRSSCSSRRTTSPPRRRYWAPTCSRPAS